MSVEDIRIVGCPQWGAVPPRHGFDSLVWTPRPANRIIFHHTAGHHAEIENPRSESEWEAIRYARDIQAFHMGPERGWNDSGHNFLVCRNGMILQGRWRTIRAIQAGKMIVSAHCPGFNDQVGIEHEHAGSERMTAEQEEASAELQAWIAYEYIKKGVRKRREGVLAVDPHSAHFSTTCPANLINRINPIRNRAQILLAEALEG